MGGRQKSGVRLHPRRVVHVRAGRGVVEDGRSYTEELARVLEDVPDEPTPEDWQRLTDHLVADAERRIAELYAVLADLKSETKRCDLPSR